MTYESNCLIHYGIAGQKWGVRRFQNEDGTLTDAGKRRYMDQMGPKEQDAYRKMSNHERKRVQFKMNNGRNAEQAIRETKQENAKMRAVSILAGLGVGAATFYINTSPVTRKIFAAAIKSAAKNSFNAIKSSKVALKGKNLLKHLMQRRDPNSYVLNKNQYKIFDPRMIANR